MTIGSRTALVVIALASLFCLAGSIVLSQTRPSPDEYRAVLNYRIDAPPAQRALQFARMGRQLAEGGFRPSASVEEGEVPDAEETRLEGTVARAGVRRLLDEPHVRSALLIPSGQTLPVDPSAPVEVSLELATGLDPSRQAALEAQVRARLAALGFRENVGYDHRGHTRLVGWIPAGRLDRLLEDLRGQPGGWLAPDEPYAQSPSPLRYVSPILLVEVLPPRRVLPPVVRPVQPAPAEAYLLKLAPELRARLAEENPQSVERLEVILATSPLPEDASWRDALMRAARGLEVEGLLGPIVTVRAPASSAAALARLPFVSTVRYPRKAHTAVRWMQGTPALRPLREIGIVRLHEQAHRGRGIRLAVVDADFRGWQALRGTRLPRSTHYVDVTVQEDEEFRRAPAVDSGSEGRGTACAAALALAAPEADLTLVRIDAASPYQLEEVARAINGEGPRAQALNRRREQLAIEEQALRARTETLEKERRETAEDFSYEEASVRRREAFQASQRQLAADRADHQRRTEILANLERDLAALRGVTLVASSLVWEDGYPLRGGSALSLLFEDRPFRAALWFQAAGDSRGQIWNGLFRDEDGNGVMEFAAGGSRLPDGRWTTELNFLGAQAEDGSVSADLTAGTPLHLSVQWTEAHDPTFFRSPDDPYRRPLADLRLVLLRQVDPAGKRVPPDEMDLVAQTEGLPERLEFTPIAATYELTLNLTIPADGRYALRVEGRAPRGTRPGGAAHLPALERVGEIRPRIFVDRPDTNQGPRAARPIFVDFVADNPVLGMPAGSPGVISVGAAAPGNGARPYSPAPPSAGPGLLAKPDVLMFDGLGVGAAAAGTAPAAALAAGTAAAAASGGVEPAALLRASGRRPMHLLGLP